MTYLRNTIVLALATLAGACTNTPLREYVPQIVTPYRIDIQQGNFVTLDMVDKLETGQTKEQVRFILGTPLLTDVFHQERWDFIFRSAKGWNDPEKRRLTVFFDKTEKLEKWEAVDVPKAVDVATPAVEEPPGFFRRMLGGSSNTTGLSAAPAIAAAAPAAAPIAGVANASTTAVEPAPKPAIAATAAAPASDASPGFFGRLFGRSKPNATASVDSTAAPASVAPATATEAAAIPAAIPVVAPQPAPEPISAPVAARAAVVDAAADGEKPGIFGRLFGWMKPAAAAAPAAAVASAPPDAAPAPATAPVTAAAPTAVAIAAAPAAQPITPPAPAPAPAPTPTPAPVPALAQGPAVASAAALPDTPAQVREAITAAVEQWREVWSSKNVAAYLASYEPKFTLTGLSRAEWQAQRTDRIRRPASIRVTVSELRMAMEGDGAVAVSFIQKYESPTFKESGRKLLVFGEYNGKWLIREESFLANSK